MEKGNLIVMEGACDGIGKTTQYERLWNHLTEDGVEVVHHHFPSYGTVQGALVEEYLKGHYGKIEELSPYFVNSLYALDRAVTWVAELKKEYESGKTILLDRYTTSSLIYQSALIEDIEEKKKFLDYVTDFEYQKLSLPSPDHVIFLDAPFDVVTEMRRKRTGNEGVEQDIHERDLDFMRKTYENALFVARYLSWDFVECYENERMKGIDEIHDDVYRLVKTNHRK